MVEEMAPLRSVGFGDPGWEHGIAQDERKKKVKCNYCGKIVSGGIYRLKQHLARVSGEVTYCDKAPVEVYLKMKENLEGYRSSKKPKRIEDDEQSYLNYHYNDDDDKEEMHVGYRSKGKQLMGDESFVINLAPLRSLGYVDPGWEHGAAQDERKKKVKCNYCEKIVSGGINRFKQHLARIPGEVAPCKNAPEEVYLKIKENMKWHRTGKRQRRSDAKEISAFYMHSDNDDEDDELLVGVKRSGNDLRRTSGVTCPGSDSEQTWKRTPKSQTSSSYKQMTSRAGSSKKPRKEVISAICKFFYYAGVSSHAANSPYFHKMLEVVGQHGPGLVGPPSRLIHGRFLQDEIDAVKNHLLEYKSFWEITGCSVMADSWRNTQGRTLINFLVYCSHGVYFVSSVDATDVVEDAANLFMLLDNVVEEIGEENVVQVVTDSTPSYKAAGKMLEEKRRNLFWTPCAVRCIDRMLEDFINTIKWVGECMEKGQRITKFIYNHVWVLNLMKKEFTGGHELLQTSITRFASGFMTLQSFWNHRFGLKRMFQSHKWLSSRSSKSDEGKEVEKIVLNATFWKKMKYVTKSVDPMLQVLQKVDSYESVSIPFIYNDIYRAKFAMKTIHGDDARKYGPFWCVIDNHWSSLFHHPPYMAAYFLNPSYRYRPDFIMQPEVMRGLNECIARLEPDSGRRITASTQISDFVSAKADFGTELAISTRMELDPAAWWQQHGINCLELQRIAVRILSQTCSSYGCEHSWSSYDQIRSQRHNRLSQKKLDELIYVHYNLRLRERQLRKTSNDSLSLDNLLLESSLEDWILEVEKQTLPGDEEVHYSEMEHFDGYENDVMEYEDECMDGIGRRRSVEMAALVHVQPLEVIPANSAVDAATDDDTDLDFLDDEFSD